MPVSPTYPGVYIQELASGVRTITGVATSTAAFVDYFRKGPTWKPVQIFNWGDFEREFGGLDPRSEASYAIQQFFLNGGTQAWVVRAASSGGADKLQPAEVWVAASADEPAHATDKEEVKKQAALLLTAASDGDWGNNLRARVDPTLDGAGFNLTVTEYGRGNGSSGVVRQEVFRNLTSDSGAGADTLTFVGTAVNDPGGGSKLIRATPGTAGGGPCPNGTLSRRFFASNGTCNVSLAAPAKLKVAIGGITADEITLDLSPEQLRAGVELGTVAFKLRDAIRGAKPDIPAFADADVEVIRHANHSAQLRVLAGTSAPDTTVEFDIVAGDSTATTLQLARGATSATTLISGDLPESINLDPHLTLQVDDGRSTPVECVLPFPIGEHTLAEIVPELQRALRLALVGTSIPTALHDATVLLEGDRLIVVPGIDAVQNRLRFTPTAAADALHLVNAPTGGLTVSGALTNAAIAAQTELTISVDSSPTTITTSAPATGIKAVAARLDADMQATSPRLRARAVGSDDLGEPDRIALYALEGDAINAVTVTDTAGHTTARDLLLTDAAQIVTVAQSAPLMPAIDLGPLPKLHVELEDDTAQPQPVAAADAVLAFPPGVAACATIAAELERAVQNAATAFVGTHIIAMDGPTPSSKRLLVLGAADAPLPRFTGTGAGTLMLDTRTLARVLVSGELGYVDIDANAAVRLTIGADTLTAALTPPCDGLANVASALQRGVRSAPEANGKPAFTGLATAVVGGPAKNHLVVLPGGSDHDLSLTFENAGSSNATETLALHTGATINVQEYELGGPAVGNAQPHAAEYGGQDGGNGVAPDGNALVRGIRALDAVDLFNLLCLPRAAQVSSNAGDGKLSPAEAGMVLSVATQYCEKRRAFLLIDTNEGVATLESIKEQFNSLTPHPNAALFYPRVKIPDPMNKYRLRSAGASGTLAGLFARTDAQRGVWKAPAGIDATLVNIPELEHVLTDDENGVLNQLGINCLRNFPIYGRVSWGARTLKGADQQASEWKYIPVRRLALYIEESLYRGTKWAVFEPNDEPLWAQLRLNIGAFMNDLYRKGAFQGSSPREAYLVKCDKETTTQNDIDHGIVNILVGFAPLKPAEFVIISIQQLAGHVQT